MIFQVFAVFFSVGHFSVIKIKNGVTFRKDGISNHVALILEKNFNRIIFRRIRIQVE